MGLRYYIDSEVLASISNAFNIAYTTSISKCFDIGCDIQLQCTSISKLKSFNIEA